jgi:hypothetical protein
VADFTVNNPALRPKAEPDDKTATVSPIVEVVERDGVPMLAMLFSKADLEAAKTFTDKAGKQSKSAGFRLDTNGAGFAFHAKWISVSAR